jgi:hypothetical protein
MTGFLVIESTPDCLPESDPAEFIEYSDAVEFLGQLLVELADAGFDQVEPVASPDNLAGFVARRTDTVAPDLGRTVVIVRDSD